MTKQQLRQQYGAQRKAISLPEMHLLLAGMLHFFQEIPLSGVHYLLSFKAITAKMEVPVHFFEEWIRNEYEQAVICFPQANFADNSMQAFADNDQLEWETVKSIEQPSSGDVVLPKQLDVVLVPLLAFDEKGYRVGYGKGFYDRYLAQCRPDVVKIGVSFFEPIFRIEDTDEYDVPLSFCVTPQKLYVF